MFNFKGDIVPVNTISWSPVLGWVMGGSFVVGLACLYWNMVADRDHRPVYLLIALFGLPLPRDDDAERAVLAALELARAAGDHGGPPVRIGIATGLVVVGDGDRETTAEALGDDHDLAVLVAGLDAEPDRFGDAAAVDHTRLVARHQQHERHQDGRKGGPPQQQPHEPVQDQVGIGGPNRNMDQRGHKKCG